MAGHEVYWAGNWVDYQSCMHGRKESILVCEMSADVEATFEMVLQKLDG